VDKSGWKVIAIMFILLFILSWFLFGYITKLGLEELANEEKCQFDICSNYEAFYFDGRICFCYEGNNVVLYKELK